MVELQRSETSWDYLYVSGRLGKSAWSNQAESATPEEIPSLKRAFKALRPDVIVELGTRFGGTTLALHDALPRAKIFSFDVGNSYETEDNIRDAWPDDVYHGSEYAQEEYQPLRSWFPPLVRFLKVNFHKEPGGVKRIVEANLTPGDCVALFVDGHNKPLETELFTDWLEPGDILSINNGLSRGVKQYEDAMGPGYERVLWKWSEKHLFHTRFWRKHGDS